MGAGAAAYAARWREAVARQPPAQLPHVVQVLPELGTVASEVQFEFGLEALIAGLRANSAPGG